MYVYIYIYMYIYICIYIYISNSYYVVKVERKSNVRGDLPIQTSSGALKSAILVSLGSGIHIVHFCSGGPLLKHPPPL